MERRALGTTGIEVSKICLGTMTWGYQNTQEEAFEQMDYALKKGVNFMDTAEIYAVPISPENYTKTETIIGNYFNARGNRNSWILATKCAGPLTSSSFTPNGKEYSFENIIKACEGSLKRLKTDVIDLYQFHWPMRLVPIWGKLNFESRMYVNEGQGVEEKIEEVLQACKRLQDEGKVREFGLSNETPWGIMKFLQIAREKGLPKMQSIQNAYSLLRREYEVGLSEISLYEKVACLPYSPLAGGFLSGKYQNNQRPEGARYSTWGKERMGQYLNSRASNAVDDFVALANELNIKPVQLANAFVNDRGFVTSNIIGATSVQQLKECISSANIQLSGETLNKIDELFTQNPNPGCF